MNLNITVESLCKTMGVLAPDSGVDRVVKRVTSLESAGPEDCAFVFERGDASVFEPINIEKIKGCRAGVIFARQLFVSDKPIVIVDDPLAAFTALVHSLEAQTVDGSVSIDRQFISPSAQIHPTACIHPSAVVGDNATIGAHAVIDAGVVVGRDCVIGERTRLYPNVSFLDRCTIGPASIIHAGTVIGSDGFGYIVTQNGLKKIPHIGAVAIGAQVEIGAQCAVDRALFENTIIGNAVKLDNLIHVAHNVSIGDGSAILAHSTIGGSAKIGKGCQIGGHVVIKDGITIADFVKIVSTSAVVSSVTTPGVTLGGQPAMPFNEWKRIVVSLNKLPEMLKVLKPFLVGHGQKSITWWQRLKRIFQ